MNKIVCVNAKWVWLTFLEGVLFGAGVTVAGAFILYIYRTLP